MEARTTGTLPGDNRQTGTLASDRQTGTLPMDRQTGTLPIDNQSNRVTSTLQSDIKPNKNYYNHDEDEYIYDLEIGEEIKGNNDITQLLNHLVMVDKQKYIKSKLF